MDRVLIYGGSFNPFTRGHAHNLGMLLENELLLGREALNVLVMPCHGHSMKSDLLDGELRLEMCRLGIREIKSRFPNFHIEVSDFEIRNNLSGSTYEMMHKLKESYEREVDFSIVIGQDNADNIHEWKSWEKLITEFSFIVVQRGKVNKDRSVWYKKNPHCYICHEPFHHFPSGSATDVRESLKGDKRIAKDFLHPDIFNFIIENDLYSEQNGIIKGERE